VIKGLKQRILKLEQRKLQSELRTTNLEELKITVEMYFEEIQRLKILLNAAEKSRADLKGSQRQQKALGATVLRLSESLKQILTQTLTSRKHKQLRSTSNGRVDYGDMEEMYDENIRLKKSLVAQRCDNQQMKAKLRRLEEDTVIKGLKQRILKLEQRSRADLKGSQRQQKALGATVLRLSESLKQVQQDNAALREDLNTDSPAEGIKGYREWSKQRLVRRLLELEKRLEAGRKPAQSAQSGRQSERGVQTVPMENLDVPEAVTVATEEVVVPMGTEEVLFLRGGVDGLEAERKMLQETLASKDVELSRLKAKIEDLELEKERWKDKQELALLRLRVQTLEEVDRTRPADPSSASTSETASIHRVVGVGLGEEGEGKQRVAPGRNSEEEEVEEEEKRRKRRRRPETRLKEAREKAARTIQKGWREHRDKDVVMLQSALRGHLLRQAQLSVTHTKLKWNSPLKLSHEVPRPSTQTTPTTSLCPQRAR
ncbi:hypothetical protein CRUP_016292, partial [Coryphaenoides rupestris]